MTEFTIRAVFPRDAAQKVQNELDKDLNIYFLMVSQRGLRANLYINQNYICSGVSAGSFAIGLNRSQVVLMAETIRNKENYVE